MPHGCYMYGVTGRFSSSSQQITFFNVGHQNWSAGVVRREFRDEDVCTLWNPGGVLLLAGWSLVQAGSRGNTFPLKEQPVQRPGYKGRNCSFSCHKRHVTVDPTPRLLFRKGSIAATAVWTLAFWTGKGFPATVTL